MTGSMIGRVFNNRYQITDRIGIGGMAEVYRAQDTVLGRLVAVKVMLPQYAADPEFTQRFRQEAASAANLQSPYIVNVYDWGQDGGTYYIVMEYVRGSDLKTAIQQRGPINQRKVAEIGAQVCQALSVAHNQDIMHRDIKPQNIMVQPDGNVKVMDFGIARAKNSMKSQTSAVLGTAHYISPEQAQGKELTSASDIYSLGIVMYEAVTGELPFDGPDSVSVAMKQVNELPVPPSQINPNIDPTLEAIIMRALEKDPYARFATVADMKHALNDFLAGRAVSLGGAETNVMYPAGASSTSVMPALPHNSQPLPQAKSYSAEDSETTRKKERNKKIVIAFCVIAALAVVAALAFALTSGNKTTEIAIPDVAGKTAEQATTELTSAGFTVTDGTEVFSDTVEAGKVVNTNPGAGTKAEKGSSVAINVSKGAEQVEIPDLSGMTADQAQQALSKAGLKSRAGDAQHSDSVEADKVMSQDPAAGTKVNKNSVVTYVLSKGADNVTVPNVVGQREGTATANLQNAGLKVTTDYDYSDSVSEGLVISQNPSDGSLAKGGTVSLVISLGKEVTDHTVSAKTDSGASLDSSSETVSDGDSATFTVTLKDGYEIDSISDTNGVSYTASNGSFTVKNVKNDISVTVSTKKKASSSSDTSGSGSGSSSNSGSSGSSSSSGSGSGSSSGSSTSN